MAVINDRRSKPTDPHRSSRERFKDRVKEAITDAIDQDLAKRSIDDLFEGDVDVTVPRDWLEEPFIHHKEGGRDTIVLPGNREYDPGDRAGRPPGGGGKGAGSGASRDGNSEDDFVFSMTQEEVVEHIMRELELPDLWKKAIADIKTLNRRRAGYMTQGSPARLDLRQTAFNRRARLTAIVKPIDNELIQLLREKRDILYTYSPAYASDPNAGTRFDFALKGKKRKDQIAALETHVDDLEENFHGVLTDEDREKIIKIDEKIAGSEAHKARVPSWTEHDKEFRRDEILPQPTTKAVMFCLMDVSGSMTEQRKAHGKLFFFLLKLFLTTKYDQVDVVYIRHTQDAKEVDEKEFFYGRDTGGTIVASAYEEMLKVIDQRYAPSDWNIYSAQVSDGDCFGDDAQNCYDLLTRKIMQRSQAHFYAQVDESSAKSSNSDLWTAIELAKTQFPERIFLGRIKEKRDILPVFRSFFEKKVGISPRTTPVEPA